jgi:hypothetical protein
MMASWWGESDVWCLCGTAVTLLSVGRPDEGVRIGDRSYASTHVGNSHEILGVLFKAFEMQDPVVPSLDQLTVFLAVVETGSFAAAGRRLGRATSTVSYAIAHVEQLLGLALFDRDQARACPDGGRHRGAAGISLSSDWPRQPAPRSEGN